VIAIEVFGARNWRPAISSGGVAVEVSRLRSRALVGGHGEIFAATIKTMELPR
jgi:hypothetical protein